MVSGERGQRAAAMMVGEVDKRYTADTVKCFRPEMRDAAESHLRQREGVRGPSIGSWKLPKCEESPFGLSVNKIRASGLFWERVERLYKIESDAALKPGAYRLGCLVR